MTEEYVQVNLRFGLFSQQAASLKPVGRLSTWQFAFGQYSNVVRCSLHAVLVDVLAAGIVQPHSSLLFQHKRRTSCADPVHSLDQAPEFGYSTEK